VVFEGISRPWMAVCVVSLLMVCGACGVTAEETALFNKLEKTAGAFLEAFITEKDAEKQWGLLKAFDKELSEQSGDISLRSVAFKERCEKVFFVALSTKLVKPLLIMYENLNPENFKDASDKQASNCVALGCIANSYVDLLKAAAEKGDQHILFMNLRELVKKCIVYAEQCKRLMFDLRDVRKYMDEMLDIYPNPEYYVGMVEYRKLIECLMSECEQKNLIGKVAGSDVLYSYAEMLEYANRIASPYVRDGLVAKISAKM